MPRIEKLIARLRSKPPDMAGSEVRSVLRHFGWTLRRTRGSHEGWGDNGRRLVLARHGKAHKRPYLADIVKMLGLEEDTHESQE
ncbi:MAG: type II toxin-antitoxin system HicA family toxin [candidate division WOR-3 bacterium]|nr:type II toxin-antitoxin system HicA family toxin [candidate division WOR-3 bacterium]